MSETELYHHANFHADQRDMTVHGQNNAYFLIFLIGNTPGGNRPMPYIFRKLPLI